METPDNDAGRWTDVLMHAWRQKLLQRKEPQPSTETYNAAHEAAYETLDRALAWEAQENARHVAPEENPLTPADVAKWGE